MSQEHNPIITEIFNQQGVKSQEQMKALDSKRLRHIDINGEVFQLTLIGGRKGVGVALKLKQLALPLLGRAIDGIKEEDSFIETPKTFTDMAVILNHSLSDADMESIVFDDILFDVKIKKGEVFEQIDWDEFLMGNYNCLIPLLAFAIKENFSSFFTGSGMMKGILGKLQNLLGSNQDEPQETHNNETNS